MPCINRIRVNNVKYNFGTQFYDDFSMRLHGKNTLYDLANGGGKSVLMLLLLQNMIPNCTLDDKQPIEKLFRTGNNNTTIHSLVEWKLDPNDSSEGYRYMTTGFCARKAKTDGEGEEKGSEDVAAIEYFNYCIFYREYNKNDIINLPLMKDGERIGYSGLKNYLKELGHRDMSLMVRVFDRKGEYQRFISDYGIHESQWEIIRGINKTEGHVRTYFENNYKTTRKVVEDLLIEEIIEKAYDVKTSNEADGGQSMARTLISIKEQLTELAKKKKDISLYGHQIELISLLREKVSSFMELYREESTLSRALADICVTGEEFAKNDEEKLNGLIEEKNKKQAKKDEQRRYMECLKVARDKNELAELRAEAESIRENSVAAKACVDELIADKSFKECANEYIEYVNEREQLALNEAMVRSMLEASDFDEKKIYTYVYNIKNRIDARLGNYMMQLSEADEALSQEKARFECRQKLLGEAQVAYAVAKSSFEKAEEDITHISDKLARLRLTLNDLSFIDPKKQYDNVNERLAGLKSSIAADRMLVQQTEKELFDDKLLLAELMESWREAGVTLDKLISTEEEHRKLSEKLDNICTIYGANDIVSLQQLISERITAAILERQTYKQEISKLEKRIERLAEGRIIDISAAASRVINYIETRHGLTAMYGMDYLSALSQEQQRRLLESNPELPYGVIVKEFDAIYDDQNIRGIDTGDTPVSVYAMELLEEKAVYHGDNAFTICAGQEYLTDEDTVTRLIQAENDKRGELKEKLRLNEELLGVYRQDQEFVIKLADSEILDYAKKVEELKAKEQELGQKKDECTARIKKYNGIIQAKQADIAAAEEEKLVVIEDLGKLQAMNEYIELLENNEDIRKKAAYEMDRLKQKLLELESQKDDGALDISDIQSKKRTIEHDISVLKLEWDSNYKAYYDPDKEYEELGLSDDELRAGFKVMISEGARDAKAIDDKRVIADTLKKSMDRILVSIRKKGTDVELLRACEEKGELFVTGADEFAVCNENIDKAKKYYSELTEKIRQRESRADKLEGSIEYAVANITAAYGAYEDIQVPLSEILTNLSEGEELLQRLSKEAKECEEEYRLYMKQQGYMLELYKDVARIVKANDIDTKDAQLLYEDKDKLRELFEETLISYDRNKKRLDKAKNELIKFKGNTAMSLEAMSVFELANTIREDVVIPEQYDEARQLVDSLKEITEYIALERDRIEKSLTDMENIKENFEEQCLQRCLDVKTELDKLPKLSKIMMDGEAISIVGLSIPYVKEEFRKQRMSEYIDRVVAQADDYANDKDRMKFIRNSLTLKKLFGVIVTDMNGIKLSLYKRERIKEQSRYLKYEEAVGSTGQSQGIYIQFLVSIINYISGMYRVGNEDDRTKTVFIDNPFGAAKDVYIWEPIFALLKANHVQLIVPARGATPAITGRFDVNYILGQQMSGGRQLTVVADYTSNIDQEEVEYKDLYYEQVSFDFI